MVKTAIASSGPTVVEPTSKQWLIYRCRFSFPSVPCPGWIPDKQPFPIRGPQQGFAALQKECWKTSFFETLPPQLSRSYHRCHHIARQWPVAVMWKKKSPKERTRQRSCNFCVDSKIHSPHSPLRAVLMRSHTEVAAQTTSKNWLGQFDGAVW